MRMHAIQWDGSAAYLWVEVDEVVDGVTFMSRRCITYEQLAQAWSARELIANARKLAMLEVMHVLNGGPLK